MPSEAIVFKKVATIYGDTHKIMSSDENADSRDYHYKMFLPYKNHAAKSEPIMFISKFKPNVLHATVLHVRCTGGAVFLLTVHCTPFCLEFLAKYISSFTTKLCCIAWRLTRPTSKFMLIAHTVKICLSCVFEQDFLNLWSKINLSLLSKSEKSCNC